MPDDRPLDPLLDGAPCGFLAFTEEGTVTAANRTLLELLGYERGQVVGHPVERILGVGSRIFYQTHWFPLLRMQGRAEEIFMLLRTVTGEDVGVLVNAARREGDARNVFDCVLMRVTERQKYEDALLRAKREAEQASAGLRARTEEAIRMRARAEEANRAKSRFLAIMSHELRTPLNAIAGYVQIMEMGIHGPVTEGQKQALGRVARLQEHLLRLINEVLDSAKLEAAKVEFAIQDARVDDIVRGVVPVVEPLFTNKGVAFDVDLSPGLALRGDAEKVRQILINLLGNASKFTPAGGRVAVQAEESVGPPGRLFLRVIDNGIGIPSDKLDLVFEPFVQVEGVHPEGSGTGLGLAISRNLARGMGGELTAQSQPGKGSTFTLAMPLARG